MKPYDQTARTEEEIRAAVDALMAQMTLEEKIGQLVQSPAPPPRKSAWTLIPTRWRI